MPDGLSTPRLIGRPIAFSDAAVLSVLHHDPQDEGDRHVLYRRVVRG
jgi:hypothetical protein